MDDDTPYVQIDDREGDAKVYMPPSKEKPKASYGIDAPFWLCYLMIACFPLGIAFLWSSLRGKIKKVRKLLSKLEVKPDHKVLDVGCGRGLFLIHAAKYLNASRGGRAYGVDIWNSGDQWNNRRDRTMQNIIAEGVQDCCELRDGDARSLPFDDSSMDLVVSSFMIHNLIKKNEREKVLAEMVRVLRPGGYIIILDIQHTKEYARYFRSLGFLVEVSSMQFLFFPMPTRWLIVKSI